MRIRCGQVQLYVQDDETGEEKLRTYIVQNRFGYRANETAD